MAYWFLGGGLVLLLFGSEAVVRGGVAFSRALNLSPLLIGLLVITTGTSAPEFAVSLEAAHGGAPDIALANVVGSNILNLLLILGLAALVRPLSSSPKVVFRDGGAMLLASAALAGMAYDGRISRIEGLALLLGFAGYLGVTFFTDWRRSAEHSVPCAHAIMHLDGDAPSATGGVFLFLFGFVGVVLGAHFTLSGAEALARDAHLSQALVGLTVVAFAASAPDLIVTIVALARGQSDIAVGHLIASNVFNSLGALGLTAAGTALSVNPMLETDLLVMAAAGAVLLPLLILDWRLSRPRGALLVLSYACYLVFLVWRQGLLTSSLVGAG
jgi:cation:H+ antiporter